MVLLTNKFLHSRPTTRVSRSDQGGICQGCRISHSNWRSRKLRNQNLALRCSLSCLCWTLSFIISKVFRILRRRGYLERSQISLKRLKTAGLDYHSWICRKIYCRFIIKLEPPWSYPILVQFSTPFLEISWHGMQSFLPVFTIEYYSSWCAMLRLIRKRRLELKESRLSLLTDCSENTKYIIKQINKIWT